MTATQTTPVTRCRHCGVPIRPSDLCVDPRTMRTYWLDEQGWENCDGTDDTHAPTAECRVVDTITAWTSRDDQNNLCLNVHEGDLILHAGRLELVGQIHFTLKDDIYVRVEFAGHNTAVFVHPAEYVAVRRYAVEEAA